MQDKFNKSLNLFQWIMQKNFKQSKEEAIEVMLMLALGAFLLLLANFLAIEIAAAIIFNLFGITGIKIVEKKGVKKVETNLRKYITPQIKLVVRSVVGTDTGSGGYIPYFDESKFFNEKVKD